MEQKRDPSQPPIQSVDRNSIQSRDFSLSIKQIVKVYKDDSVSVAALRGIDYTFKSGNIYVIFGPSGSGKTTLLAVIGGIEEPTSGKVGLNDVEINLQDDNEAFQYRTSNISFIFQEPILISFLDVVENIKFPVDAQKKEISQDRISDILNMTGLADRQKSHPYQLSGGEKQRLGIAMSLASNNPIWLCDEPTGQLDTENKQKIIDLLNHVHMQDPNKIIIIVTHDPLFQKIASEMIILKDGLIETKLTRAEFEKYRKQLYIEKESSDNLNQAINKQNLLKKLEEIKRQLSSED